MLEGWKGMVRISEGGSIARLAPPIDISFFVRHTFMRGDGHEFELVWRDAKGNHHHSQRRMSEQFRLESIRPQVFWKNEVAPDLRVQVSLEHPSKEHGDDVDKPGGVFRVSYVLRDQAPQYVQRMRTK